MALLTLKQVRASLWNYGSSVSFATASTADKSAFDAKLNQVIERFLLEGKWRSTFRRVTLRTYGNTLTLPRNLATCLGCDPLTATTPTPSSSTSAPWGTTLPDSDPHIIGAAWRSGDFVAISNG